MKNIHDSMFAPGICSAGYMVTGILTTFSIVFKIFTGLMKFVCWELGLVIDL